MQNVKINNLEFEKKIFKLINNYYFTKFEKIYGVAVSGGPDSMLLLHVLYKWAKLKNKTLIVFSFNHNLRLEALKELTLVKNVCKNLGCKFIKLNWGEKPNTAVMQKARIARYSQISKKCKVHNIKTLFLGHHADDIAETVSMRILKKSNIEGLCPIFEVREIFDIKLFRPFLKINKEQILNLNLVNNIEYLSDSSNLNNKYSRTRIRKLLQTDQKLKSNLIAASKLFCKIRQFNLKYIKTQFKNFYIFKKEGFLVIDRIIFTKYPKFLIINFLKTSISRIGNKSYFSKHSRLNEVYFDAKDAKIFTISLGGCILEFKVNNIIIFREFNDIKDKIALIKKNSQVIWDNRFNIINNTNFTLKVHPLGDIIENAFYKTYAKFEKKKIKSLPYMIRKTLPAIITLEGLIHIPHLTISELNLLKKNIQCLTVDFFNKKYDNIYNSKEII